METLIYISGAFVVGAVLGFWLRHQRVFGTLDAKIEEQIVDLRDELAKRLDRLENNLGPNED